MQGKPDPEKMMAMIASAEADEIDCDGAFALLHRYADLLAAGQDAEGMLPAIKRHIELCRDCREELEALLRAVHAGDFPSAGEWRP